MIAFELSIQDNLTDKIWWGYCEKCGAFSKEPKLWGTGDAGRINGQPAAPDHAECRICTFWCSELIVLDQNESPPDWWKQRCQRKGFHQPEEARKK